MAASYLVDTNVLLRLAYPAMAQHSLCRGAESILHSQGSQLHYTLQNATEFWNVSTRPVERNGHGRPIAEILENLSDIEATMTLLSDGALVYTVWKSLVTTHQVRGVQVHDARLAASMLVHRIPRILTLNTADFARYPGIEAVHPSEV